MFSFEEPENQTTARIVVIGVGGGGGNAVNSMIQDKIEGVEFVVGNTDLQALSKNRAPIKIQLGKQLTKGLGAGSNPDKGRDLALEDADEIKRTLEGADLVFVTAGMGGGTGTGAAPIIAKLARELGCLTVGIVTRPFDFEGRVRATNAAEGIRQLKDHVDTLVTIPNQRLFEIASPDTTFMQANKLADSVLKDAVQGISDLITKTGSVNVDFADVRTIMSDKGVALMGIGRASGPNRAIEAAEQAISSPLLDDISIDGATSLLINITSNLDLGINEVNLATRDIRAAVDPDANIIFGHVFDESMGDEVQVTVIATGFEQNAQKSDRPPSRAVSVQEGRARRQSGGAQVSRGVSTTRPPVVDHDSTSGRRALRRTFVGSPSIAPVETDDAAAVTQETPRTPRTTKFLRSTNTQRRAVEDVRESRESLDIPTFVRKKRLSSKRTNESTEEEGQS